MFPNVQIKLCDFGLVRSKTHTTVTVAGDRMVGTLAYTAPEVLVGVPLGTKVMAQPSSDIWSMSCSAIEWFNGKFPWKLDGKQDLKKYVKAKQRNQSPPDELCHVVESVQNVLQRGLDYEFTKRPNAEEMTKLMGLLVLYLFCTFLLPDCCAWIRVC